jgi:hypothetical protein
MQIMGTMKALPGPTEMLLMACAAIALCGSALAADEEPRVAIEAQERWSGVFGRSEASFHFSITSQQRFEGVAAWSFSAKGRTISRGEAPIDVAADRSVVVTVPLRIPPVSEGVVFEAQVRVQVAAKGGDKTLAEFIKPVCIFPADAFSNRQRWLQELNIALFDPVGATAAVFDKAGLPYRSLKRASAIQQCKHGVLVIGEGVSLDVHRALGESLAAAAARGVAVLCLAPGGGSLPLPGASEAGPLPQRLFLRRAEVIRELDKRIDADGWPPAIKPAVSGFAFTARRSQVLVEVSRADRAWPWLEAQYPGAGATLILCGFGIVQYWDDGPAPRFLLKSILERLDVQRRRPQGDVDNQALFRGGR